MKVAIMQPYVFPFLGYFQLVDKVDTFVFYDDVNFIKKGYVNRNYILSSLGKSLFTIPCKKISQNKLIKDIELSFNQKEKETLISRLWHCYSRAPYFRNIFPLLESFIINNKKTHISEFAIDSVILIADYLQINTVFKKSSENFKESKGMEKSQRLIKISKSEKAKQYYNSIGGKSIYDKRLFNDQSIDLKFLKSKSISYNQFNGEFVPNLSIIDVLMFNSVDSVNLLLNEFVLE